MFTVERLSAVGKEQNGDSSLVLTVIGKVCGGVKAAPTHLILHTASAISCVKVFKERLLKVCVVISICVRISDNKAELLERS